jgi:hypothetical protein
MSCLCVHQEDREKCTYSTLFFLPLGKTDARHSETVRRAAVYGGRAESAGGSETVNVQLLVDQMVGYVEHHDLAGDQRRDRNLLSGAEGGRETSGPETAPRAGLRPPVLHGTILNPPC